MVRNLQETVARNRNAVSVYSPTRRVVRPSGGVANAGTAGAVLGGRGPVEAPPIGTANFGGAAAAPVASQLPGWAAALGTMGQGPQGQTPLDRAIAQSRASQAMAPEEPGGFWGSGIGKAIGTAVNNPVGRGLMTALDVMQYPRRIVQSTIKETADIFNGGDASFDDWTSQIGDEAFDARDFLPQTGNSFLDGLVGFGADMVMDPVTFVGGSGLWTNIAGRTARAGTAAEALALGVKVGNLSVRETSEQIAKFGFARFNNAARAELKEQLPGAARHILDRGYHFKVPLTQRFIPIPGTAPADWLASRGASRVRATLSDSPIGGWMRYATNPGGKRDAVTTLVTGRSTGGLSFGQAAEVINWNNGSKLAQRAFQSRVAKMADDVVKAAGGGHRGREALNDLYRTAEAKGGTSLHQFYSDVRDMAVKEYGVHIPKFDGPYLPHFRTTQGHEWLEQGSEAANDFKNLLFKDVDINKPASVTLHRQLVAGGKVKIGGQTFDLVDGTADELNRIFRKVAPDAKFDLIDTDFASTAHKYIKSLEENVGTIGGLKKVLGSKSGLVRSLHDDSFFDMITADDIDRLAERQTADVLKTRWREASHTVRKMRQDSQRGISDINGSFGVELREALGEMQTLSKSQKKILDDLVAEQGRLEDLRGVGKYSDRLNLRDGTRTVEGNRGKLTQAFEQAYNTLAKRFQVLESQLGRIRTAAVAEARRIEAQGGVGARPIQEQLRALKAEQAATSADLATIESTLQRLDLNRSAQDVVDARLGDQDFINLSVADDLSPKSPGAPQQSATPPPPAYTGPSPVEISTDFNSKRTAVLGMDDPRVSEVAARYDTQVKQVDHARERLWRARTNHNGAVDAAHRELLNAREYEAGLAHAVEHTRGRPEMVEQHLDYSNRLEVFQQSELPRRQAEFRNARKPIDDAESVHKVQVQRLGEIRDEQMQLARAADARGGGSATSTDFSWAARHPIGDPVDPTPAITDRRQAAQQFVDLPDDALVTVYHATSRANADALMAGRTIDPTMAGSSTGIATPPGELYVGGMYDQSGGYGDTTLAITVRKRDLHPSPEAGSSDYLDADWFAEFGDDAALTQGLFLSRHLGATLKNLDDVADVRIATKGARVTIRNKPSLPLSRAQETTLRSQRRRLVRDRNKVLRTPEGVAYTKAAKAHATVTKTLDTTNKQIEDITAKGGRFFVDADGVMQPKFTTQEQWALDLIEQRRTTLLPARDAARARYDAAAETLNRLERSGTDLWGSSSEAKAAQREMSAAFKARKEAEYAIVDANRKLGKIRDVPDLGRITKQTDELNQLLAKQASQQARVDELTHELAATLPALREIDDGVAGIDSQLAAQTRAIELQAEAPVTPYTAQISSSHRAEQQRLDAIESAYPAARTWDEAPQQPARPSDLGRFEGQFENNPTIARAMHVINQLDGRVRIYNDMDPAVDVANSAAAIRAAAEPFTVPPVGTPAHTAVIGYSPASHGGAMGAVGRGQAVTQETQRVLENHVDELVTAGAIAPEFADDMVRRRVDLDAALDQHALNPSADLRADLESQAAELGRITNFALRYKAAIDGGNEPSDALGAFLLARELDDEAASLRNQIDIGNARLADPRAGANELTYSHDLARLNERAAQRVHQIETEVAKGRTGGPWDERAVDQWTRELGQLRRRIDASGPPVSGSLDDAVDTHAAYAAGTMRDLDDAEAIFAENRFVDHRMQWPVRRRDQLAAEIPAREAEVMAAKTSQKRLSTAVSQARDSGAATVRYQPYTGNKVVELSLAQAEAKLIADDRVIRMLETDLVNKQVQSSVLDGSLQQRLELLRRERADVDTPPVPTELAAENDAIQAAAQAEQRALTPAELETVASNRSRIERLNRGPLPGKTVQDMDEEIARLSKVVDDFDQVMGGDVAHVAVARDGGESLIRGLVAGGGPISERSRGMLNDLVGTETAAAAQTWIHFLDEAFAGQTAATVDEFSTIIDDAVRMFGDNELVDRMRERAIASFDDGTVALDEMRDELTASLIASANRQRGESIREFTSMHALLDTSFVDTPGGLVPRFARAAADEPSHQLLTARLRVEVLDAMRSKGYDPRNAMVDTLADLRTRLGRVETMRRGVEGNEEWMDVLLTGTPSAQARAQTREALRAGKEALQVEEGQLEAQAAGMLDTARQARTDEYLKQLDDRVTAQTQPIETEMLRLQRQADEVERSYTAQMDKLDMELGAIRTRVMEAMRDRNSTKELAKSIERLVKNDPAANSDALRTAINDVRVVGAWRQEAGDFSADEMAAIEGQLVGHAEAVKRIDAAQVTSDTYRAAFERAGKDAKRVAQVISDLAARDMRLMAHGLIEDTPEGLAVSEGLAKAIEYTERALSDSKIWTFIDKYTAFFKTYATSRPGFHVRNALSATFMNLVDGVRIRDMYEGARLWRQYERGGDAWLRTADQHVRDAFTAVAASGAGGRYIEPGLFGDIGAGGKMYKRVMDNALTRWNQRLGSRVEGSARLSMALNSAYRGATPEQMMRRITKFHFDYTEMSDLDHMARRMIPFWTFMSRNLPLQVEQMLTNPRMYLQYQNMVRNFGEPLDPYTPDYWISAGAFTVDKHAEDREAPWYIAPDLPHLQVTEPLDAMARGEWGKALLSDINPLLGVPLEIATGEKMFSGASLEGYEQTSDANPFLPLFNLLGGTATGGSGETVVDKRYAHAARSLLPPWEFVERLADPTGKRAGRTDETIYRALGVPVRQMTPQIRESERRSEYYDRLDRQQTQAELARM